MINIKTKVTTGLATAAMVVSFIAPSAFASTSVHISGNGAFSDNYVSIMQRHQTRISQLNEANISNKIEVNSSTGGNQSNFSTGGNTHVVSGHSSTHVSVQNHANTNSLNLGSGNGSVHNGNGAGSMYGHNTHLSTQLSGSEEVPGPGDHDGSGWAKFSLWPSLGLLCTNIKARNIAPAAAAHIHEAVDNASGPVVITLPTPNSWGHAQGCMNVDSALLAEIQQKPHEYYVNVHNTDYPNGAVRGQL